MLTVVAVPKPFRGAIGEIQRRSVESWLALDQDLQIVLLGNEDVTAEIAAELRICHVAELETNEQGTPRLDSALASAERVARYPIWCYLNSDIVLLDDFLPAVRRVQETFRRFLVVGRTHELEIGSGWTAGDLEARRWLRQRALTEGRQRGYAALDYFVFPRGHFGSIPPFLVGRACYDNWLVWKARQVGPVVDASDAVVAVHQRHDYLHVPGGLREVYYGPEAQWNERLAGGRSRIFTLYDASHTLRRDGRISRYWGSAFRARERVRAGRARIRARRARARRRLTPVTAVFPAPTAERNRGLELVAEALDAAFSVLYITSGQARPAGRAYQGWVLRGVGVPFEAMRRAVGGYPVSWTIWRALCRLRPACVVLAGQPTFAARAARGWCRLLRVPVVVVLERRTGEAGDHECEPRFSAAAARHASARLGVDWGTEPERSAARLALAIRHALDGEPRAHGPHSAGRRHALRIGHSR